MFKLTFHVYFSICMYAHIISSPNSWYPKFGIFWITNTPGRVPGCKNKKFGDYPIPTLLTTRTRNWHGGSLFACILLFFSHSTIDRYFESYLGYDVFLPRLQCFSTHWPLEHTQNWGCSGSRILWPPGSCKVSVKFKSNSSFLFLHVRNVVSFYYKNKERESDDQVNRKIFRHSAELVCKTSPSLKPEASCVTSPVIVTSPFTHM